MGKNVAVFVDVANVFYAAKSAGVDVDYVDLLKHASAGRDLVRAYAYTGLDPENENQRNFHSFLARHGYKVVSKDIRKYGDGKVKANLDIELVVDMMKTARNLDIAIVVSGDGDFAPAIRAVQEMGVRVEVVSFRGNTSSDLIEVADLFTDITKIAVSDRSAVREREADEADLSMTVVPEKESEGTGRGRGRGGRGRPRAGEPARAAEPRRAAASAVSREPVRGRSRSRAVEPVGHIEPAEIEATEIEATPGGVLVALPGERLSKARRVAVAPVVDVDGADEPDDELVAPGEDAEVGEVASVAAGEGDAAGDDRPRRRRRRGGRGRGRGHDGAPGEALVGPDDLAGIETIRLEEGEEPVLEPEEEMEIPAPAPRRHAAFGSVWDSQLGMSGPPAGSPARTSTPSVEPDELDEDEPAIPEYLIAERRQGQGGRGGQGSRGGQGGRGGQGNRAGYAAAVDRERYGGGRGARPPEANRGGRPVGAGSGGGNQPRPTMRNDRPERSGDAFSDVPPEIEAMLRAQLAAKPQGRTDAERPADARREPPASGEKPQAPRGRGRGGRGVDAQGGGETRAAAAPAATDETLGGPGEGAPEQAPTETGVKPSAAPKRAPRARSTAAAGPAADASQVEAPAPDGAPRRATRTRTTAAAGADATPAADDAAPKPRRARSAKATSGEAVASAESAETAVPDKAAAPRRATRSRKVADAEG